MNICVFLASRTGTEPEFAARAQQIGSGIAERGHKLIFGGSNSGLMKILCESCLKSGGFVTGVTPDVEYIRKKLHPDIQEKVYADSLAERKARMINDADCFFVLPGGPGSIDEFGEVLNLMKIGTVTAPMVFVNTCGFYDPLKALIENMKKADFFGVPEGKLLFSDDINEIFEFAEQAGVCRERK